MLFKLEKQNKQFKKNGYVVIKNFFNSEEVNQINELYKTLNINNLDEIYTNLKDRNPEINLEIDLFLKNMYTPKLEKYFKNYSIGGGAFLIKGIGEASVSSLHQDWNVVDESKSYSMGVWCPLVDVNENNGCLQIVPGSHSWFNKLRSFNMPSICINFDDVKSILKPVISEKGDAVIFAHNVFHGSKPNYTQQIRPVASVSVISKDAPLIHYFRTGETIKIIKAETFFNYKVKELMAGKEIDLEIIDEIDFKEEYNLTEIEFMAKYNSKHKFINKLMDFFKI
jgi:ectoine hydroxylase-related dioxygenase (phytanoyl-CoA dioxygenase family)